MPLRHHFLPSGHGKPRSGHLPQLCLLRLRLRFPTFAYGICVRTGNYVIIFSSLRIFVSRHDTASANAAVRLFTQSSGACRSGCEAMADGRFGTDNFSDI